MCGETLILCTCIAEFNCTYTRGTGLKVEEQPQVYNIQLLHNIRIEDGVTRKNGSNEWETQSFEYPQSITETISNISATERFY